LLLLLLLLLLLPALRRGLVAGLIICFCVSMYGWCRLFYDGMRIAVAASSVRRVATCHSMPCVRSVAELVGCVVATAHVRFHGLVIEFSNCV
jgi:hypothetical protein